MTSPTLHRLLTGAVLVFLCALVITVKGRHIQSLSYFDPADGEHFYWTEAAFHFRHTRMIAEGRSIPRIDTRIQHPEGLDTQRYVTTTMDHVYGRLYRWFFKQIPLHVFLAYAVAVFSTLSVVATFWAGFALSGRCQVALMGAALYALAPASLIRSTGTLIREDFTLPLLFGSMACLLGCMRKQRLSVAVVGASLLAFAMTSWHVSPFFFELLVVGLAGLTLLVPPRQLPRLTITIYILTMAVSSLGLSVLRAKYYFCSPPLMAGYALMLVIWLLPRSGWSRCWRTVAGGGLFVAFSLGGGLIQWVTGAQSHVFAVLWAKVQHLGVLPADPVAVPFEARVMWASSFVSPSASQFFLMLSTTLLFAIAGLVAVLIRTVRRCVVADQILVAYFAVVTVVLFLFFERLMVFAVFFLVLLGCLSWPRRTKGGDGNGVTRWNWRVRVAVVALFVVVGVFEVGKFFEIGSLPHMQPMPSRPHPRPLADVTRYLREHTDPDDAVVCAFQLGPSIAAYADRPVLLHSKFESKGLRDKVAEIYTALFSDEQEFYRVCRRYDARYLVYRASLALRHGPGSPCYVAGHHALPVSSVVFAFQFAPERLQNFLLVHQNSSYRIYRIGGRESHEIHPRFPPHPNYDLGLFVDGQPGQVLTGSQIDFAMARIRRFRQWILDARRLGDAGWYGQAVESAQQALAAYADSAEAWKVLAEALYHTGEHAAAAEAVSRSLALDPDQPELREALKLPRLVW